MNDDAPPPRRSGFPSGCLGVLLTIFGGLLLLPGVCASDFLRGGMPNPFASAGLVIAGAGVAMLVIGVILLVWKALAAVARR